MHALNLANKAVSLGINGRGNFRLAGMAVLLVGTACFAQTTFPTSPIVSNVGALSCGLRLYTATAVQTYCYFIQAGQVPLLVHNTISTLSVSGSVAVAGHIRGTDQILWIVQRADDARANYQINTSQEAWKGGILGLLDVPNPPQYAADGFWALCCLVPYNMPTPFYETLFVFRQK